MRYEIGHTWCQYTEFALRPAIVTFLLLYLLGNKHAGINIL